MLLSGLFVAVVAASAHAQSAPVSGKVELKKADGTQVPLQGVLVEPFRTDIKSKAPTAKTNKKGEFYFVGLPLGTYVIAFSAPGAQPTYLPNVKAGSEGLTLVLEEGDGRRLTETEVRDALKSGNVSGGEKKETATEPASGSGTGQGEGTGSGSGTNQSQQNAQPDQASQGKQMSEEEAKKAKAEYDKKVAEVTERNKKIENKNTVVNKALADGNAAFKEKNYEGAIAAYDQGIQADPDFVGSAPVLLNNKAVTLKIRGIDLYNKSIKSTDQAERTDLATKARKDLADALDSYNKAWEVSKNAPAGEIVDKANFDKVKYDTLSGLSEIYRLIILTKTPLTKPEDAKTAFDAYLAVETDAAKKIKAQSTFGQVMLESGDADAALAAYQSVLASSPNDPDALIGAGLSLVQIGYATDNKAKFQEAADFLQKFLSAAPADHKLKDDATAVLDTLKKEQNVAPQKGGGRKKN